MYAHRSYYEFPAHIILAPSRSSKTNARKPLSLSESAGRLSPSPRPSSVVTVPASPTSASSSSSGRSSLSQSVLRPSTSKPVVNSGLNMPLSLIDKNRESYPAQLQEPEEQTDNWDDDFEEGISLTKLKGLDKSISEDEKLDGDDNARTIRPHRSPMSGNVPLAAAPAADLQPIVEDYSDLASEEDDVFQDKVANFRLKSGSRPGLFHPKDITTLGLSSVPPAPNTAPLLPSETTSKSPKFESATLSRIPSGSKRSSSRSSSFAGSLGRVEAARVALNQEIDKYAEEDDEDYDDIFGKPNSHGELKT